MKTLVAFLVALALPSFWLAPATAQDEDCWHYEDGNAYVIDSVDTPGYAQEVAVVGEFAYMATDPGLVIIDISIPGSSSIVSFVELPGESVIVAVQGDYAYVCGWYSNSLVVVDVSDPLAPSIVGQESTCSGYPTGVAIAGDHAYVAFGEDYEITLINGLCVIDVSDPANPVTVGQIDWWGWDGEDECEIAVNGSYAYTTVNSVLRIIDIGVASDPIPVGEMDLPGVAAGIAIVGDLVYLANMQHGLLIVDVSDPAVPLYVGGVDTPGEAHDVSIEGDFAYVADWDWGLQVIDITEPASPQAVGAVDTPGDCTDVALAGNYVYLADGWSGLQVAWRQCDEVVAIEDGPEETTPDEELPNTGLSLAVHPNPFNPQATITFALERDEWATVSVFELTGKRVALLTDRTFDAGTHSLLWNGRDEAGRAMPSGTYLVRLETESAVRVQKLMLIR